MKLWIRLPLVLGFICILSAGGVGSVYILTKDRIRAQELKKREEALAKLFGEGVTREAVNEADDPVDLVYRVVGPDGRPKGYVATGTAQGYSSRLHVMVGMTPEVDRLTGIEILQQNETPGLGSRVQEVKTDRTWLKVITRKAGADGPKQPWFQQKFAGLPVADARMDREAVQEREVNITGATITSDATKAAVNDAIRKIVDEAGKGSGTGSDG